jgi:hypothetical protein
MFDSLKAVPKSKDFAHDNTLLQQEVERIRSANPHLFLQPHELKERKFFDEPASRTPMRSFVQMCPSFAPLPVKPATKRAKK